MNSLSAAAPLALGLAVALLAGSEATAAPTLKGRAVWASPSDAGTTEASVVAFVDQLAKAHVNTLVMEVKTSAGLFWPSERFAPAVVAEYRDFDFPAVLIRQCHRRKIAVHAWFFDFAEGADSYVARQHPEWLALGPRRTADHGRDPARPPVPAGLDVSGPPARLYRPVAHSADQGVRAAVRRGRDPPRLRALPGRPRARHVLLLRLLSGADPEVRRLLLARAPRPRAARAHGPPAHRGPLGA